MKVLKKIVVFYLILSEGFANAQEHSSAPRITPITPKIGLYTRFQGLYVYNPTEAHHERSFLSVRTGLSIKNYQFGIGADANWYGPFKVFKENVGVFVRTQLY
ncbi:MAG: hypothetical protein U5L45_19920 [Saprospiraceae bacterium]|nr:hypothetical protein [Saprospiraceae bacterium]